jgi:hypothetical protein
MVLRAEDRPIFGYWNIIIHCGMRYIHFFFRLTGLTMTSDSPRCFPPDEKSDMRSFISPGTPEEDPPDLITIFQGARRRRTVEAVISYARRAAHTENTGYLKTLLETPPHKVMVSLADDPSIGRLPTPMRNRTAIRQRRQDISDPSLYSAGIIDQYFDAMFSWICCIDG